MALVLKYKQTEYNTKVSQLEAKYTLLQGHLDRLTALKDEISDFWGGGTSSNAREDLTAMITAVSKQMDRTKAAMTLYDGIIENLETMDAGVTEALDTALGALKLLV